MNAPSSVPPENRRYTTNKNREPCSLFWQSILPVVCNCMVYGRSPWFVIRRKALTRRPLTTSSRKFLHAEDLSVILVRGAVSARFKIFRFFASISGSCVCTIPCTYILCMYNNMTNHVCTPTKYIHCTTRDTATYILHCYIMNIHAFVHTVYTQAQTLFTVNHRGTWYSCSLLVIRRKIRLFLC